MDALHHSSKGSGGGDSSHDVCKPDHNALTLALSLFLCAGLVISYLPQILRIILKKSSLGFSPWFLLLGATSSASTFLNVVTLQWGVVRCCARLTAGQCAESLLAVIQTGLQWFLFVTILALFLVYYPVEKRYERTILLPPRRHTRTISTGTAASTDVDEDPPEDRRGDEEDDDDDDDDSSIGDIDSIGSHIAANYSTFDQSGSPAARSSTLPSDAAPRGGASSSVVSRSAAGAEASGLYDSSGASSPGASDLASRFTTVEDSAAPTSSSAFDRLVPSFWPVWRASKSTSTATKNPGPSRLGPGISPNSNQDSSAAGIPPAQEQFLEVPASSKRPNTGRRKSSGRDGERQVLLQAPRGLKLKRRRKVKRRTEEWRLAIALSWLVVLHFIFIVLVTLLLISTLPKQAFFPPNHDPIPPIAPAPTPVPPPQWLLALTLTTVPSSSRLLLSRWATFLGLTGTLLACAQYVPQLIHTYKTKLVGSLSIPMMILQVPGSAFFVYSLAVRPGIEWSSLLAYISTGVLQGALLVLCLCWKRRQAKLGIDDFGKELLPRD